MDQIMNSRFNRAMELIKQGKTKKARKLLEDMEAVEPNNPYILYNLGMLYSDLGHIDFAIQKLEKCLRIASHHINAMVALGLAYLRGGRLKDAEANLLQALQKDPENIYALQNLGGLYAKQKRYDEAITVLEKGERFAPEHPNILYGLALAYHELGKEAEADTYYRKVLNRGFEDTFNELARKGLSSIASSSFRKNIPRMDAVMYCLAAMERFHSMEISKVHEIAMEIALLGRSGLKTDDPTKTYNLASMTGDFTGLQLVSYMYVAFKMIDSNMDIGFDLSVEYQTAKSLFTQKVEDEQKTVLRDSIH